MLKASVNQEFRKGPGMMASPCSMGSEFSSGRCQMARWLGTAKAWFSWNCQLEPPTCAPLNFLTAGQLTYKREYLKGVFQEN